MSYLKPLNKILGFPGGSTVKNPLANVGDAGLIPGSGRAPMEDGNLLQYSCLGNSVDSGACQASVNGVLKIVGHELVTKQQQVNYETSLRSPEEENTAVYNTVAYT